MEIIETIIEWVTNHETVTVLIGTGIYEVVGRLIPTTKRASIFSWIGKSLLVIGKVSFFISDILGKIIVDKKK